MNKDSIKRFFKGLTPRGINALSFIVSVTIVSLFFSIYQLLGDRFEMVMNIMTTVLLGLLLLVIIVVASFDVLGSLFLVAAELTLLIFLAQSYCNITDRPPSGDEALKILLSIGILYIGLKFARSLHNAIKTSYRKIENKCWSLEKIMTVSLYLIFVVLFISQIYYVVGPILNSLCVKIW